MIVINRSKTRDLIQSIQSGNIHDWEWFFGQEEERTSVVFGLISSVG